VKTLKYPDFAWGVLFRAGDVTHLVKENCVPVLWPTRQLARNYIEQKYGYIKRRPDLHPAPHNWQVPVAVKVAIVLRNA
jgi:hypothetical protein